MCVVQPEMSVAFAQHSLGSPSHDKVPQDNEVATTLSFEFVIRVVAIVRIEFPYSLGFMPYLRSKGWKMCFLNWR